MNVLDIWTQALSTPVGDWVALLILETSIVIIAVVGAVRCVGRKRYLSAFFVLLTGIIMLGVGNGRHHTQEQLKLQSFLFDACWIFFVFNVSRPRSVRQGFYQVKQTQF